MAKQNQEKIKETTIDEALLQRAIDLGWQPQSDGVGCWRFVKGNVIIGCSISHSGLSWCSRDTNNGYAQQVINFN